MEGVTKSLDQAMKSMDLEKVSYLKICTFLSTAHGGSKFGVSCGQMVFI